MSLKKSIKSISEDLSLIEGQTESIIENRRKKPMTEKIWVPKTFILISIHPFFDYMKQLLENLVKYLRREQKMADIFEAYVYKMVFEIPTPLKDKKAVIYDGVFIYNVDTLELPYVADDFFRTLFDKVEVNSIISIFTHMLCQTPIILAAEHLEELVPIHQALYSLIYPFVYSISAPCVHNNDAEDDDDNELQHIITMCPVFNGILHKDVKICERIIRSN